MEWPVIIQGALGSALFWCIIQLLQRAFEFLSSKFSRLSTGRRKSRVITLLSKYWIIDSEEWDEKAYHTSIVIYRSLRDFYRAMIWLTLGLILNSLFDVLAVIGFIGCLFYLLSAINSVQAISVDGKHKDKIEKLVKELDEIKKHNK
jgi:hypothetical protein